MYRDILSIATWDGYATAVQSPINSCKSGISYYYDNLRDNKGVFEVMLWLV